MTKRQALLDIADFHTSAARGERPKSSVSVQFRLAQSSGESETRVVPFVFSDDSVDSYNDRIDAKGWQFDRSGAGTICLFGHDPSKVENIIGRAHNVRVEGNQLLGDITFATKEENPNAEVVFQLVSKGFLNSCSVGFQPIEWRQAKDPKRPGGLDFTKQKLLEISIVGIPANENAVAQARAAGIDIDRLELVSTREAPVVGKRGLYSVSALAGILADLGWVQDSSAWEAEYEGDGSEVPGMLLDAMKSLGAALVAMTIEEVAELLAGRDDDDTVVLIDGLVEMEAPTPAQKIFAALVKAAFEAKHPKVSLPEGASFSVVSNTTVIERAGKVLSKANETKIRDAHAAMTGACDTLQGLLDAVEPDDVTEKVAEDPARALRERRAKATKLKNFPN